MYEFKEVNEVNNLKNTAFQEWFCDCESYTWLENVYNQRKSELTNILFLHKTQYYQRSPQFHP